MKIKMLNPDHFYHLVLYLVDVRVQQFAKFLTTKLTRIINASI